MRTLVFETIYQYCLNVEIGLHAVDLFTAAIFRNVILPYEFQFLYAFPYLNMISPFISIQVRLIFFF